MEETQNIQSNLESFGFCGHLLWVHNEEGSGARFYNSSVYFPDSLSKPITKSGVTIDPGLDLGNCSKKISLDVINEYFNKGLLTGTQTNLLKSAIGLKTKEATVWMRKYKDVFKNRFLVDDATAVAMMDKHTAPSFWKPLKLKLPNILTIKNDKIKKAVHTALLSFAYNRGTQAAISLVKRHVDNGDWEAVAAALKSVTHSTKALNDRREREANLIYGAVIFKKEFHITFENINPFPMTAIPFDKRKTAFANNLKESLNV